MRRCWFESVGPSVFSCCLFICLRVAAFSFFLWLCGFRGLWFFCAMPSFLARVCGPLLSFFGRFWLPFRLLMGFVCSFRL